MSLHLCTDIENGIQEESWDGRVERASVLFEPTGSGEICFTTKSIAEAYRNRAAIHRVGCAFHNGKNTIGAVWGFVFRRLRGKGTLSQEEFYDWCDSATEDAAQIARTLIDNGNFSGLFSYGDALVLDAFEFTKAATPAVQISAMRSFARAIPTLPGCKNVTRALICVGAYGSKDGTLAFRKEIEDQFAIGQMLKLGESLSVSCKSSDVLISPGKDLTPSEELIELAVRTGIVRAPHEQPFGATIDSESDVARKMAEDTITHWQQAIDWVNIISARLAASEATSMPLQELARLCDRLSSNELPTDDQIAAIKRLQQAINPQPSPKSISAFGGDDFDEMIERMVAAYHGSNQVLALARSLTAYRCLSFILEALQ